MTPGGLPKGIPFLLSRLEPETGNFLLFSAEELEESGVLVASSKLRFGVSVIVLGKYNLIHESFDFTKFTLKVVDIEFYR